MGNIKTKTKLLSALETLCADRGFHRVQVADITSAAGLSAGAFYRYFKDKDEILFDLLNGFFIDTLRELKLITASINQESPTEKFETLKKMFAYTFSNNVEHRGIFLSWYRHGYGVSDKIDQRIWDFTSDCEKLVEKYLDGSKIVEVPEPKVLAQCIIGMTLNLSHQMVMTGKPDQKSATDQCTQFICMGLLRYSKPGKILGYVAEMLTVK